MLRIREGFDLAELEKYGFTENRQGRYAKDCVVVFKDGTISGTNRGRTACWSKMGAVEELFDLIVAGIVVKG